MSLAEPSIQLTPAAAEFLDAVVRLRPRVAAFDCDGTLWDGDSGQGFFYWELAHGLLPEAVARQAEPRYRDYLEGKVDEETMCGEMVTFHEGISVATLQQAARQFFQEEFASAIFPEMRELARRLQREGCAVWAVSSTNDWVVAAGTRDFGIPEERLLAACVYSADDGIATGRLRQVPTDEGKAVAIRNAIGPRIDMAFGNSLHDAAMLAMATHAFAINPNSDLLELARLSGWQVYYPMGTVDGAKGQVGNRSTSLGKT
jgi:phosphoserine phosphatase